MDLENIYQTRFGKDFDFRNKMWNVLCSDFFQKYIPENSTLLEIGSGYAEFINNIRANKKYALDLNPDSKKYIASEIEFINTRSSKISFLKDESLDVIFMSNFLEHLERSEICLTLKECHRCLKKKGKLLILQPNIRYLYKEYWRFFDHLTPLDDRALCELLYSMDFSSVTSLSRFLPYTTKGCFPKSIFLLRVYLKIPLLFHFFGKQSFILAVKS